MRPWIMPWLPGRPAGPPGQEQHSQERFQHSEGATVDRWLSALPAEVVRPAEAEPVPGDLGADRWPRLMRWSLCSPRPNTPTPMGSDRPASASGHANVPAMLAILRAELARQHGDADQTVAFARQALPHIGGDDRFLRYLVGWNLAVAMLLQGRAGEAEQALAEIAADRWAAGEPYNALRAYTSAAKPSGPGPAGAALATCRQGLERAEAERQRRLGVAHLGLGWRSCGNETNWRAPWTTPPRARCAGSWATPSGRSPAWPRWPGSGRRAATSPAPWRAIGEAEGSCPARSWSPT